MKPLQSFTLEFWPSSADYLNYGVSWWQWVLWYVLDHEFYKSMRLVRLTGQMFARGAYNPVQNKIILCAEDISFSSLSSMQKTKTGTYHRTFGLQLYFTLIHEMLHKSKAVKAHDKSGHVIDFDKFEKLPEALKDMFDGLLELENSNDAFARHPENRRKQ